MNWSQILNNINNDFFNHIDPFTQKRIEWGQIDKNALSNRWMGFPPATEIAVQQREEQLQTRLPPSYRQFLLTSNGFLEISPFIYNLYPVEKIDWASNIEDPWWLNLVESGDDPISDEDYLNYGKDQRPEWIRAEYFRHSLKISDWGDASCIFLNPIIKHDDEWEVLEYGTWLPGARRYKSFRQFMITMHENNLRMSNPEKNNRS
jgi:cell wall assembly regulator SMI1